MVLSDGESRAPRLVLAASTIASSTTFLSPGRIPRYTLPVVRSVTTVHGNRNCKKSVIQFLIHGNLRDGPFLNFGWLA
jgi:hypothetical protein